MLLPDFVKKYIANTNIGDVVINAIRIRTLDEKLYIPSSVIQYRRDRNKPTEEMEKSRRFFQDNEERIQRNIQLLSDDESKECYEKAINYSITHNMRKRPRFTPNIYFVKGIIDLSSEEVFVDGGAFVGDTVRSYKRVSNNQFKRVICFEPDTYNYKQLRRIKDDRILAINKGLSDFSGRIRFFNNGSVGSRIVDEKEINCFDSDIISYIDVTTIDEVNDASEATFIKMDVEGAELSALHGAKKTIVRNKPKLAICLYHTDEDMLSIIEYIHELVPEYRLYVRHHSLFAAETVLYAVI